MMMLDNPNIIKLYEVYEGEYHIYLVMELLNGTPSSYIGRGRAIRPDHEQGPLGGKGRRHPHQQTHLGLSLPPQHEHHAPRY